MYAKNITYLKDLPDLDDLEGDNIDNRSANSRFPMQEQIPSAMSEKIKRMIRPSMGSLATESGMGRYGSTPPQEFYENKQDFTPPVQNEVIAPISKDTPNCLDIYSHIDSCPICSSFFKRDTSIYIIAIVILSIICILLLKKVLNL